MKIIERAFVILWVLAIPYLCVAQGTANFYNKPYRQGNGFSIRGGLNYSMPTVTAYYINNSIPLTVLGGIRPRTGYYIGGSYFMDLLPERVSLRVDATLQVKRTSSVDLAGSLVQISQYYYAGLRPMLGLQVSKRLVVNTGVEVNLLLTSKNAWGHTAPLDIGPAVRFSYRVGPYGLELGYYRGFIKYDRLELKNLPGGPSNHDFYNQTFETGLIYTLK